MGNYRSNYSFIRAGSNERITFTLYVNNVIFNLTGYTIAEIRLKRLRDDHVVIFRTDASSPLLSFDNDLTTGRIHLDPESDTFQNTDGMWAGYINVIHSGGNVYSFEEDNFFGIEVRDTLETTTSTSTTTTI